MKRLLLLRQRGTERLCNFRSTTVVFQQQHRSIVSKSSSVDDATATSDIAREKILRAPFQKVAGRPLFPWRHSEQLLDRLVPNSLEFQEKGNLVGGNIVSSNPTFDAFFTGYMFLEVPWYKMIFFKDWQQDTAENMTWAFTHGVSGVLSNVYQGTLYCVATSSVVR
jgi:hypothetical protein